jgi:4-carboxymuconolactone decarboxylase
MNLNLLIATPIMLSLFATGCAHTNRTGDTSGPGFVGAPDSQKNAQVRAQTPVTNAPSSQPRPSQRAIGDFAPKLAELTDNVLYADVWERPELSKRDRNLVTVAALIAMNRPDHLRSHFTRARDNGVTQDELIEAITHIDMYDKPQYVTPAVAKLKEFFEKNLKWAKA